jgi:hypothetical protein
MKLAVGPNSNVKASESKRQIKMALFEYRIPARQIREALRCDDDGDMLDFIAPPKTPERAAINAAGDRGLRRALAEYLEDISFGER